MYIVAVTLHVKPEALAPFIAAARENARATRREPGNVRFDVLQGEEDPARFLLYEVYRQAEDFVRHQQTPHYLRWKETVAPLMAQPRQGVKYHNVFPADGDW